MKLLLRINSGYLFLFSFLTVFIITPLFQQGVFGDGIMYLTVAFNRFKGYGSFWEQRYSETSMSFFCEQPPLYFESLNWFYKIFGGAEIAEKIFTLFLLASTVFLMASIWNMLTEKKYKQLSWLPSLLLVLVPVFSWAYCNQVIETMVVPLSLLVFYLHLIFIRTENKTKKIFLFLSIIVTLFLLLITKGVQSVFLIAALFLYGAISGRKNLTKCFLQNLLLVVGFSGVCAFVFLTNEKAHFWLTAYFHKRIVATFNHVGATASYHAEIIVRYFSELIPVFILLLLVSFYVKIKCRYSFSLQWKNMKSNKTALWLILISLSASLPLSLTLEQRGFYLTPSFPFVVLGIALLYKRYFFVLFARVLSEKERIVRSVAVILSLITIVFFFLYKNEYKRDEAMIKDVQMLKKIIPFGEVIGIDRSMWNTFSLHSYINKANNNSLAMTDTSRYFIQEKENKTPIPVNYVRVKTKTLWLDVYQKEK
jgi:4-amino-4-deoxy-L-arabinose transferase-like glycosyltransferase